MIAVKTYMANVKKLKIIEKKLGREGAWGTYYNNVIEMEPRQKSRQYLKYCIHELLHHADPTLSESRVCKISSIIAKGLWQQNFRRIMR